MLAYTLKVTQARHVIHATTNTKLSGSCTTRVQALSPNRPTARRVPPCLFPTFHGTRTMYASAAWHALREEWSGAPSKHTYDIDMIDQPSTMSTRHEFEHGSHHRATGVVLGIVGRLHDCVQALRFFCCSNTVCLLTFLHISVFAIIRDTLAH